MRSPHRSGLRNWLGLFLRGRSAKIGLGITGAFLAVALLAPWIAPYSPTEITGVAFARPSLSHILGTDDIGEDIFSQLIWATRGSLLVGFSAGGISAFIGTVVGLNAGFRGRVTDETLMRITDVMMTLPLLPLLIIFSSDFNSSVMLVILVIGFLSWPVTARVIRSQTLSMKSRPFVDTGRLSGMTDWEIMLKLILPNEISLAIIYGAFAAVSAVVVESGLDFIGLGPITNLSWGVMLYFAQARNALLIGAWWWFLPPGLMIALFGTGLVLIGQAAEQMGRRVAS
jgi:peptide/nickel transport system permease protein